MVQQCQISPNPQFYAVHHLGLQTIAICITHTCFPEKDLTLGMVVSAIQPDTRCTFKIYVCSLQTPLVCRQMGLTRPVDRGMHKPLASRDLDGTGR